MKGMPLLPLR
ncbi:hypothetical protein LINPERHAP1_LOCUS4844 [Linum perenne]